MSLGDSRAFLSQLCRDPLVSKRDVFFYLDAHWSDELPLHGELETITRCWQRSVIMIDDFEVHGDSGYRYDDYGPGKRLDLEYLHILSSFNLVAYFPSLPSDRESGLRRGCVVLADPSHAGRLDGISSLRRYMGVC
jgi:hypothetical protein